MKTRMFFSLLIATLLVLAGWEAQAQGFVKKVNCTKGQTITDALQKFDAKPITIEVKGTCNENVTIDRDDVTLIAHPSGGTVNGADPNNATIIIMGDRAVIDGLTVTGVGGGFRVEGKYNMIRNCIVQNVAWNGIGFPGGRGTVDNCTIQNSGLNGINISYGGGATVTNSTIQNNGTGGINSSDGGRAMVTNSTISSNNNHGIVFYKGGLGTVDQCTVENNAGHGILIEGSSATVINSTISSNGGLGIVVNPGGSARIGINDRTQYAGNTISNNGSNGIHVAGGSAFIGGNIISGNGTDSTALWGRHGVGIFYGSASVLGYNSITGNAYSGIIAKSSAVIIGDAGFSLPIGAPGEDPKYANMITGNGTVSPNWGGVYGYLGTSLDIRYATISGNTGDGVILRLRSTARMYDDTINNNTGNGILLDQGGGLRLQGPEQNPPVTPVTATGNGSGLALQCFFGEDSFLGVFAAGSQAVSATCSGF